MNNDDIPHEDKPVADLTEYEAEVVTKVLIELMIDWFEDNYVPADYLPPEVTSYTTCDPQTELAEHYTPLMAALLNKEENTEGLREQMNDYIAAAALELQATADDWARLAEVRQTVPHFGFDA